MRIALIADSFPPLRTSGALQLRDLSVEFVRQGHEITVMLPNADQEESWSIEYLGEVRILRLRALRMKDVGYLRRTIAEIMMPFLMRHNLRKSPIYKERWDGILWYAPSIFHGPLAQYLKKASGCKAYLILRDIFPDWAADIGLMKRGGVPYRFFDAVARYQYSVADTIGVQTRGNLSYLRVKSKKCNPRVEVLENWLADTPLRECSVKLNETRLAGKKIFVYAGNMGAAQGMEILLDLAGQLKERLDIGFLFVGRGSRAQELKRDALDRKLNNILFFDEIPPEEIPSLYNQCTAGLIALDSRHKSHNIPGKFLSYMQSGLPVLANVNRENDLVEIIRQQNVGKANDSSSVEELTQMALDLLLEIEKDDSFRKRCRRLYKKMYTPESAVIKIVAKIA